jgi:AraC-like DNA-binding protein
VAIDHDLFRRLCRARDYLCDNVDEPPSLRQVARVAGVSPHHFLRAFRRSFGETPHEYVTRVRIECAKAALRAGRSVTETCFSLGYASLGSFSALFRRQVGVAPTEYGRSVRRLAPSPGLLAPILVPFCFLEAFAPLGRGIAILEKPLPFRP